MLFAGPTLKADTISPSHRTAKLSFLSRRSQDDRSGGELAETASPVGELIADLGAVPWKQLETRTFMTACNPTIYGQTGSNRPCLVSRQIEKYVTVPTAKSKSYRAECPQSPKSRFWPQPYSQAATCVFFLAGERMQTEEGSLWYTQLLTACIGKPI